MKQSEFLDLVAGYGDQVDHFSAAIARVRLDGPIATADVKLAEYERSLQTLRSAIGYLNQVPAEELHESTREVIELAREHARVAAATADSFSAPNELGAVVIEAQRRFADIVRPLEIIARWPPDGFPGK